MKGWIALDIDGTITADKYVVPKGTIEYLKSLYEKGWKIAIITGRTFAFSMPILDCFDFPIIAGVQNGSAIFEMPSKKMLATNYMDLSVIAIAEKAICGLDIALAIYAGAENSDMCYWKRGEFTKKYSNYMDELTNHPLLVNHVVDSFDIVGLQSFPLIKCVGEKDKINTFISRIEKENHFNYALVKDLFSDKLYTLLVTRNDASKGFAIKSLSQNTGDLIIAAGNDNNDLCMLKAADVKIAMQDSPKELLDIADYIAPTADREGIIPALEYAVNKLGG